MKRTALFLCLTIMVSVCFCMPMPTIAAGELTVSSISVGNTESTTNIPYYQGSITLTMSDDVEADTLSAVTFTKADGSAIKGFCNKEANGADITVSFGHLDLNASYTLSITEELLSTGGYAAAAVSYSYIATKQAYTEDFEDMDVMNTTVSKTVFESMTDFHSQCYGQGPATNALYQIAADKTGNKYVRMTGANRSTSENWGPGMRASMSYLFNEPITSGSVTVNFKLKSDVGEDPILIHRLGTFLLNNGGNINGGRSSELGFTCAALSGGTAGFPFYDETGCKWKMSEESLGSIPKDEVTGWADIKCTATYDAVNKVWKSEFAVLRPSGEYVVCSRDISAVGESLVGFSFGHVVFDCFSKTPGAGVPYACFDDISISMSPDVVVGADTADELAPDGEEFSMFLTDDIEEAELSPKLHKKGVSGDNIAAEFVYEAESRKISLRPRRYLDYNTTYTVLLDGAGVAPFEFTTASSPKTVSDESTKFKVGEGTPTDTAPEGACTAIGKATFNASALGEDGCEILTMLVAYNEDGVVLGASQKTHIIDGDTVLPANLSVELELADGSVVENIRLFVFEKTEYGGWISVPSAE